MNHDTTTRLPKVFILLVSALILTLAAFGVGVRIGSSASLGRAALPPAPLSTAALPTSEPTPLIMPSATSAPALPPASTPATVAPETPTSRPTPTRSTGGAPRTSSAPLDTKLFNEAWELLTKQFYGDLPEGEDVTYNAIRGVVDRLGDQYTAFVDPKAAELLNASMEGSFEGIGAQVELAEGGGVKLRYLYPDRPADKAGLLAGDVIIAVDGKDVTKLTLIEAIGMIRGPAGSKVKLTVRREMQDPFDVTVTRARIEIPVVDSKTLADGRIEYVSLAEFSQVAPVRLSEALQKSLAKKPAGLILDLRGNPGGLLSAAVDIGSFFVPQGSIVIEAMKDGQEKVFNRTGRYLLGNTRFVVLVDGGSASASEIVAGAIQDAGTGVLIGEQTYGKGAVQLANTLSDGSQLRVTVARWFTPNHRAIHGVGLTPDIKVPLTPEDAKAKRDPQLDRAVEYLLNGK